MDGVNELDADFGGNDLFFAALDVFAFEKGFDEEYQKEMEAWGKEMEARVEEREAVREEMMKEREEMSKEREEGFARNYFTRTAIRKGQRPKW